jgi:NAD+ synthase
LNLSKITIHIAKWLTDYCESSNFDGFVVGVSGGIDSALVSTLCAMTGKNVILLNMPIRQTSSEYNRAIEQIEDLKLRFSNVKSIEVNLTAIFDQIENDYPLEVIDNHLVMANSRSRLRMLTLYAFGQTNNCLVVGTGNKVEDFGVGFYTKYGDGGVDISPIADLSKTQVRNLSRHLNVVESILAAKPTDGLFEDGRSDEDQIGATYPELEWAMDFLGDEDLLNERQKEVLVIYRRLNRINQHKMQPIPVCIIPKHFFNLTSD